MRTFLSLRLGDNLHQQMTLSKAMTRHWRQKVCWLLPVWAMITATSGCQQSSTQPLTDGHDKESQTRTVDSQSVTQSASANAHITQLQPIYVKKMQGLQQRLQAEYESLQAADTAEHDPKPQVQSAIKNTDNQAVKDINTSTEVGKRDLEVLKRISLEPRKPVILTEPQLIKNYQQAIKGLYKPVTTPLDAQDIDTLLNIATLVPSLFEQEEIANRVSAKSPALARLIIQHQVWEQIEAQQAEDMQAMKKNQQQEFESLMAKFNNTIKDYDEQIAKYEQTLKAFK